MEQIIIPFYFAAGPVLMLVGLWHVITYRRVGTCDWLGLVLIGVGVLQLAIAYFLSRSLGLGQPGVGIISVITLLTMLSPLVIQKDAKSATARKLTTWLAVIGVASLVSQAVIIEVHRQQLINDAWKSIQEKN